MGEMSVGFCLFIICSSGAVGGVVNALLSDNGFLMPRKEAVGNSSIIRPGFLGNLLIGAVAAGISWGLYGPFASEALTALVKPTLSALVGAALVGVAGARWLTNEVDKTMLRAAASKAASAFPDASRDIATSSPADALHIAKQLEKDKITPLPG